MKHIRQTIAVTRRLRSFRPHTLLALATIYQFFSRPRALAWALKTAAYSDDLAPKPDTPAILGLMEEASISLLLGLLALRPIIPLDSVEVARMFSLVQEKRWSKRASRLLLAWSTQSPSTAANWVPVWLAEPDSLPVVQQRAALRIVAEIAPYMSESVSQFVFDAIAPLALRRVDPYTTPSTPLAQEAVASILAERPDIAMYWISTPESGVAAENRRNIMLQAFALNRSLTMQDYFGRMSSFFGDTPTKIGVALKRVEDKYSVGNQYRMESRHLTKIRRALPVWAIVTLGLLAATTIIIGSPHMPIHFIRPVTGWREALLPLLGIIVAVHLLAIDLASGRLPRLGTVVVATSPRIMFAYGFLLGTIGWAYIGSSVRDMGTEDVQVWVSLTLLTSFIILGLVVYDLLRAQEPREVAKLMTRRKIQSAKTAGKEYRLAQSNRHEWASVSGSFHNIREAFGPPSSRQHLPVIADRSGVLRMDIKTIKQLDNFLTQMNTQKSRLPYLKNEVLVIHKSGDSVSRGSILAVVVANDRSTQNRAMELLNSAITLSPGTATEEVEDLVTALYKIMDVALMDSDRESIREIARLATKLVEIGINGVPLNGSDQMPFGPATSTVLNLERMLRSALDGEDEFVVELIHNLTLDFAKLSLQYPASYAAETASFRLDILAKRRSNSHSITSVIAAWSDVVKLLFQIQSGVPARHAVKEIGQLCTQLSTNDSLRPEASFAIERFAELLASGMYADYFASDDVLTGVRDIAAIASGSGNPLSKYTASICLLEIGGAAFGVRRYSIAYLIACTIRDAGIDLDNAVDSLRRPEIASRLQTKSSISGEVFGEDVEAGVIAFHQWIRSFVVQPAQVERSASAQ